MSRKNFMCWKLSQLFCYLIAAVGAVVASVAVGNASVQFAQKCPLYTRLKYEKHNDSQIIRIVDDQPRLWETSSTCELATYLPVGCAAYAFVLAYFILMCDRVEKLSSGSGSRNRMLGLFFPLLLSSILLSILMLISSVQTTNGTEEFCDALYQSISVRCIDAEKYDWPDYPEAKTFYLNLLMGVINSWLSTAGCILSFFVLVLRCFSGVDRDTELPHRRLIPRNRPCSTSTSVASLTTSNSGPLLDEPIAGPSGVTTPH